MRIASVTGMDPVYDVRPWAGGWGVFVGDEVAAVEPLRTSADAVAHAKNLAKRSGGGQVRVYDDAGRVLSEFLYEPEERGSLERDGAVPAIAASRPARRRPPRQGA